VTDAVEGRGVRRFLPGLSLLLLAACAPAVVVARAPERPAPPAPPPPQPELLSHFLGTDARALAVMHGTPYDMDIPPAEWRDAHSDLLRTSFAYKLFAALHMVGYDTEIGWHRGVTKQHVALVQKFQRDHALPESPLVDPATLSLLDAELARREPEQAYWARQFRLYYAMAPLGPNDVSRDWVATLYGMPLAVLPQRFWFGPDELGKCVEGQCVGEMDQGKFVFGWFHPTRGPSRLEHASAIAMSSVLHEFAHYLDGWYRHSMPGMPHHGAIPTLRFHDLSFDISRAQQSCAPRRSEDVRDFISLYGYMGGCRCESAGFTCAEEEFAEAFSFYVAAGRRFRAATRARPALAAKYEWLRREVFGGMEYDTDLSADTSSGCNDAPGLEQRQPGYLSCSHEYVWDGTLRALCPADCRADGDACERPSDCASGVCRPFFRDRDRDSYGSWQDTTGRCSVLQPPAGYSVRGGDPDDTDPHRHPAEG
jgi:hypothetical protein